MSDNNNFYLMYIGMNFQYKQNLISLSTVKYVLFIKMESWYEIDDSVPI
jgi:hypothetical protein